MASELRALYELQQIDSHLERVEKTRAALDAGSSLQTEVEQLRANLENDRQRLHELEAEFHDQDLKLKSIEAKRTQHRNKLFSGTIGNPKELENLRLEIEMLTRQKGSVEESMLTLMDDLETQKAKVGAGESTLSDRDQVWKEHVERYHNRMAEIKEQLEELRGQRADAIAGIDEDFIKRYEALKKKTNNLAVVKVTGKECAGCGVSLTSFSMRRLLDEADDVICENCGRMLYHEP